MSTIFGETPSLDAKNIMKLLKVSKNVIISGPPATGKSRLLAEVRYWFSSASGAVFNASGASAFPANTVSDDMDEWMPSSDKTNRMVLQMTFHQGTKYRDFVSGLTPQTNAGPSAFKVTFGKFYEAAEHSVLDDSTALLEIDEMNRANTVSVFGDTITALESDKRLKDDNSIGDLSAVYSVLDESGSIVDKRLSPHLYLIAAMNNADTSVQPLDIAFLRRWENYVLYPDAVKLRSYFGLPENPEAIKSEPETPADVYEALVQAWVRVNEDTSLLRGHDYQIGHGIFMKLDPQDLPVTLNEALSYAAAGWARLYAHLTEVFFGDTMTLINIIGAGVGDSPYQVETRFFGGANLSKITAPAVIDPVMVYKGLSTIANAAR